MRKVLVKKILHIFFWLDNFAYKAISNLAIKYEGGLHPKHRLMQYHEFFLDRVSPTDRVLDIGCGNGALAYDVAGKAKWVMGIEIDEKKVQEAKKKYSKENLEFKAGDATKLNAERHGQERGTTRNEEYDVVILSNVLEHIERRVEFLKSIKRIAPRFLIRVPMLTRDWIVPFKKELGAEWRLDSTHFTEFTLEQFKKETEEAGYAMKDYSVQWGELWTELVYK